ncbi:MAG: ribonuclease III [Oscillospiraceae bacterium]|nr:ribonuclease III [Oscillospiraceae bacterium]
MNEALNLNLSPAELQGVTELALAHVGDAVFELLVRQELCCARAVPVRDLHRSTVARVTAPAQAAFIGRIQPLLTAEETAVYKRGRNAHTHQAPKSATPGQYARATGLETLFGWLWLTGQNGRLRVLYDAGKEKDDAT